MKKLVLLFLLTCTAKSPLYAQLDFALLASVVVDKPILPNANYANVYATPEPMLLGTRIQALWFIQSYFTVGLVGEYYFPKTSKLEKMFSEFNYVQPQLVKGTQAQTGGYFGMYVGYQPDFFLLNESWRFNLGANIVGLRFYRNIETFTFTDSYGQSTERTSTFSQTTHVLTPMFSAYYTQDIFYVHGSAGISAGIFEQPWQSSRFSLQASAGVGIRIGGY